MRLALFISLKSLFMDMNSARRASKKKKNAENATQEKQYPNAPVILITYYFFYNFILLDSNYTRNIYN